MCFSAKASFIAAGALSIIGLLSIRKASSNKKLLPLAATPLLFATQQTLEGIVWITLNNGLVPSTLHTVGMYSFIFFAGAWWPFYVPFIVYRLETHSTRKKLLYITLLFGIITAMIYIISLLTQNVSVIVKDHRLYYPTLSYPFNTANNIIEKCIENTVMWFYLIATIIPFFLSHSSGMCALGVIMGFAAFSSQIVYPYAFASTWCFFAAIASIFIYFIILRYKKYD